MNEKTISTHRSLFFSPGCHKGTCFCIPPPEYEYILQRKSFFIWKLCDALMPFWNVFLLVNIFAHSLPAQPVGQPNKSLIRIFPPAFHWQKFCSITGSASGDSGPGDGASRPDGDDDEDEDDDDGLGFGNFQLMGRECTVARSCWLWLWNGVAIVLRSM